jgi:hypothetical protein
MKLVALPLLGLVALAGCGSDTEKITIPSPNEAAALPTESTSTQTTATSAAPTNSTYPVMHWEDGPWPFTAQLVSITTSPEGFPGSGSVPPGWDKLMVQVNIASQTTDRTPPTPGGADILVECRGPNSDSWNPNGEPKNLPIVSGWDEGSDGPDSTGANIGMGYNEPHTWDAEWEVPEDTSTTEISCELHVGIAGTKEYMTVSLM